jgi:hypothetical protein
MRLILPPPLEPVEIDPEQPLEAQLSGAELEAARVMLEMLKKSMALASRG